MSKASCPDLEVREKRASETFPYVFKFARALETNWEAGEEYGLGEFVRSIDPNGKEFEATGPGQSGSKEPKWNKSIAGVTVDGGVTWTTRVLATSATDTISTNLVTAAVGITLGTIDQTATEITVPISGGVLGSEYEVSCKITTVGGKVIDEVVIIKIIK